MNAACGGNLTILQYMKGCTQLRTYKECIMQGIFITIEGPDGAGKTTQRELFERVP